MNVIVANKYKEMLSNLDIEVIKRIDGIFSADEIIRTFQNFPVRFIADVARPMAHISCRGNATKPTLTFD